jgi:aspartyl-tRNA(Asn)/glutamyl-tRNA(Gln) amidotransferase subunit A
VPDNFFFERVEPKVARTVRGALDELRSAGIRIQAVKLPEMDLSVPAQLVTLRAEALAFHQRWIRARPRSYGRDTRVRLQLGSLVAANDYVLAQRARERMRAELSQVFTRVDLLATPTVPIVAPMLGERFIRWGKEQEPVDGALVRLTQPFNLTGVPALSVPCGLAHGLPVGIQLVAPWNEEGRLIAVGTLLEKLLA